MLNKVVLLFQWIKQGKTVKNLDSWKTGKITVGLLVGFFSLSITLLQTFGIDINISQDLLNKVASAVLFLYGLFFVPVTEVATNLDLGIPNTVEETATDRAKDLLS